MNSVVLFLGRQSHQDRAHFIIGGGEEREGSQRIRFQNCSKDLLFFLVLVARHWDTHIPTFTLNFPQLFGLTLLHSLNWYTTDKHSQRGRAWHGTNVQSFWTEYTGYKKDTIELSNEPPLYAEKVQFHLRCWSLQKVINQVKLPVFGMKKNIVLS